MINWVTASYKAIRNHITILLTILLVPIFGNSQIQIGSDLIGEMAADNFGKQLALSADGSILGVLSNGNTRQVQVYQNEVGNWVIYGTDMNGGHFEDLTASGIDISGDGQTLAVRMGGEAQVYSYESGVWTQKGSTINMMPSQTTYGLGVQLSYDGNIIAMGASNYVPSYSSRLLPPPNYHGLVQVFKFESGTWNQLGNDIVGNAFDRSAESFSLSSDGSLIAVANYFSARVYENISGVWTLKGSEIIGSENNPKIVSLSSDGSTLAFGDSSYSGGKIQQGRVQIFKFVLDDWVQVGSDLLGNYPYDFAGTSVCLSTNGEVIAISYIGDDTNGDWAGHVGIYRNLSGTWIQISTNLFGEAAQDRFGEALKLSSDANTVAIGTPFNDTNGADSGKVKIYDLSATLASKETQLSKIKLFPNPVSNAFEIQLPQGQELIKVSLYNNWGQLMFSTQDQFIQTKSLPRGLYFVEMETNKGCATKKIVVN